MRKYFRLYYFFIFLLSLVGLYYLSSWPGIELESKRLEKLITNLAHIPVYSYLAFILLLVLVGKIKYLKGLIWPYVVTFITLLAISIFDEWYQISVPGRYASILDIFLNLTGVILTFFIVWIYLQKKEVI